MKKTLKVLGTQGKTLCAIALAAVIGFSIAACGDGGNDDNGGGGGGGITGGEIAQGAAVDTGDINTGGTGLTFEKVAVWNSTTFKEEFLPISDDVPGTSITVKDGKLNMKFGTPKDEVLQDQWKDAPNTITLNPTGGAKGFEAYTFSTSDETYILRLKGTTDDEFAGFVYLDRDLTVTGTATYNFGGEVTTIQNFNYSFKKGWNYYTGKRSSNETEKTVTTNYTSSLTLPTGFSWVIEEND